MRITKDTKLIVGDMIYIEKCPVDTLIGRTARIVKITEFLNKDAKYFIEIVGSDYPRFHFYKKDVENITLMLLDKQLDIL